MSAKRKIVIDPGHGGKDPGAVGPTGLKESDVVLDVCARVSSLLGRGFEVLLTRTADTTTGLNTRSNLANRQNADILVSVHCNAAANRQAHGVETFCYKKGGTGEKLASIIQKHMIAKTGLRDRGVKTGNLHMVREPKMPACLVELAFISNPAEERLLRSDDFKAACSLAIAQGIAEYFGKEVRGDDDVKEIYVDYEGKLATTKGGINNAGRLCVPVVELIEKFNLPLVANYQNGKGYVRRKREGE